MEIEIVYRRKGVIVAIKPPGIASESTVKKTGLPDLLSKQLYPDSNNTMIKSVHRLDAGVSGLILLAENSSIAGKLIESIKNKELGKEYLAVIHGCPEKRDGEFFDYLFHNVSNNMTYVVNNLRKGVKEAQLEYHVIETVNSPDGVLSLIRINLLTGRTHQIRVQFSSRKLMLYGDNRYGARDSGGISLFSHSISFVHPMTNEKTVIMAFPTKTYPWDLFEKSGLAFEERIIKTMEKG